MTHLVEFREIARRIACKHLMGSEAATRPLTDAIVEALVVVGTQNSLDNWISDGERIATKAQEIARLRQTLSAIKSLALTGIIDEKAILADDQSLKTILIMIVGAASAVERETPKGHS